MLIRVRMQAGAGWSDACVLNLSPRGLGLQGPSAPQIGSYVELRRGRHVIIGRIVWAKYHRFGVRTQDRVPMESLIREPEVLCDDMAPPPDAPVFDRRVAMRAAAVRHDDSRIFARGFEFISIAMLGVAAALLASSGVSKAVAGPLSQISTALNGGVVTRR